MRFEVFTAVDLKCTVLQRHVMSSWILRRNLLLYLQFTREDSNLHVICHFASIRRQRPSCLSITEEQVPGRLGTNPFSTTSFRVPVLCKQRKPHSAVYYRRSSTCVILRPCRISSNARETRL